MDSIISYFLICWQKKFNYQGRARRLELGSFLLVTFIIVAGLQIIESLIQEYIYPYSDFWHISFRSTHGGNGFLTIEPLLSLHTLATAYLLVSLIPLFSVTARRLQDLNKSKYWLFYLLLPIFIVLSIFLRLMIFLYLGKDVLDIGGYWGYIILALLIYEVFLILKLLFQEGEPEENKYGKSPKLGEN